MVVLLKAVVVRGGSSTEGCGVRGGSSTEGCGGERW